MEEKKQVQVTRYEYTNKQIRELGFNLGYGVTQGIFAAVFVTHIGLGMIKAIKRHMEKKVGIEVKVEEDDKETTDK